jgi:hypothetical protein
LQAHLYNLTQEKFMPQRTSPIASSFLLAAALVVGTSALSSHAVEEDVNLFALYSSITNDDGLIGLVGEPFNDGEWTYDFGVDSDVLTAGSVDCEETWTSWQFLCDPAPTTNARGELTHAAEDIGYTSRMDDQDSVAFVVIDLGVVATFSSLEVYQMIDSDGNVTAISMDVSSATGDTSPTQGDDSWTNVVPTSPVVDESDFVGSAPYTNTDVSTFDFDDTTGRYVLLYMENDGSYEQDRYIEVGGAKLFGPRPAIPGSGGDSLAPTGIEDNAAGFAGIVALVAGAAGFALRRGARA